jgi:hypothetical protein
MQVKKVFRDVQRDFTLRYPFLKIDFLKSLGAAAKQPPPTGGIFAPYSGQQGLSKMDNRDINMDGDRTVAELVKDIEEQFALIVMVLRRSGKVWIGTSLTTYWTLEQQNREGEYISQMG